MDIHFYSIYLAAWIFLLLLLRTDNLITALCCTYSVLSRFNGAKKKTLVLCWWRGSGTKMVNGMAGKKKKGKMKSQKGSVDYS